MKLKVISLITHHNGYSKLLEKHLIDNNIEYKFLGFGEKWKGWKWRMDLIKQELIKTDCKKYIVAIIDGFDVLMFDDEKTIIEKYKQYDKDIVLSLNTLEEKNYIITTIYQMINREVNGGIYIGNPKKITELFDKIQNDFNFKNKKFDDEIEINNFLKNKKNKKFINENIILDYKKTLVYTCNPAIYMMYNKKLYDIVDNKLKNINNSSFIHTTAHYDNNILKSFNLYSERRFDVDLKKFSTDMKNIPIILLIFILLLIIILS